MSNLQLDYKKFYGRNIDQMPLLIKEGRTPLSVQGLMKRKLEDADSPNKSIEENYLFSYFDTGDAVLYHPDGRIKIVLDSQIARELTPENRLKDGALVLPDGAYESLDGEEFKREDLEKYIIKDRIYTLDELYSERKKVENHPVWKFLARDDRLQKDYVNMLFKKGEEINYFDVPLSVCLDGIQDVSTMRLLAIADLFGGSFALGYFNLDSKYGRLVGIVPGTHNSLEHKNKK